MGVFGRGSIGRHGQMVESPEVVRVSVECRRLDADDQGGNESSASKSAMCIYQQLVVVGA